MTKLEIVCMLQYCKTQMNYIINVISLYGLILAPSFRCPLEMFYLCYKIMSYLGQCACVYLHRQHKPQWNSLSRTASIDTKYVCMSIFTYIYYYQNFSSIAYVFFAKYPIVYSCKSFSGRKIKVDFYITHWILIEFSISCFCYSYIIFSSFAVHRLTKGILQKV